jgi:hypothetical protein
MSYQTGTASSPVDLLQKLATWLSGIGWTIDSSIARAAGWRMHCHKGTQYVNFSAAMGETGNVAGFVNTWGGTSCYFIALYGGTGYNSGNDWRSQPGGPVTSGTSNTTGCGIPLPSGSIQAYHFFADAAGDNIIVVIERTAGIFSQMFFGNSLVKIGTWTGGQYFGASLDVTQLSYIIAGNNIPGFAYSTYGPGVCINFPAAYVRADVDAFTSKWIGIGRTTTVGNGYTGKVGSSNATAEDTGQNGLDIAFLIDRGTSNLTGQSLLFPAVLTVVRDSPGFSFLGSIPNAFITNACCRGFSAGSIYQWGTDNYMLFPGPNPASMITKNYGFAIKKV